MYPAADADRLVTELDLTIGTGGDDLRGGNLPQYDATAILHLEGGRTSRSPTSTC